MDFMMEVIAVQVLYNALQLMLLLELLEVMLFNQPVPTVKYFYTQALLH